MSTIYTQLTIDEFTEILRKELDAERFEHSLGVAEMAQELAKRFNCNAEKAYVAGLLHDCAKCMDFEYSKKVAREHIFDLDETEKDNRKTIHAPAGAYIARERYGINDPEILSAIRFHTIGRCGMTDFEKIIFIADKIEHRTREKEFREQIEEYLYEKDNPLDKAMFKSFEITIESLVKRRLPICSVTVNVYNEMLEKIR